MALAWPDRMKSRGELVVVAAVDDSPAADTVVALAARSVRPVDGELHILHVVPSWPRPADEGSKAIEDYVALAKRLVRVAREAGVPGAHAHPRAGDPARTIVQAALDLDADLLVLGTHGRTGIRRLAFGSVAEWVVRHASCSVLVARAQSSERRAAVMLEACSECLRAQHESRDLWCARHSQKDESLSTTRRDIRRLSPRLRAAK